MKPKLNRILLIDDSRADNYVHRRRIRQAGIAREVVTKENGRDALSYLTTITDQDCYPAPDLIFLDINMPVMNGWEFLERYGKLDQDCTDGIILFMLTTSVADRDRQRADGLAVVDGFLEKPLTREKIDKIVARHFTSSPGSNRPTDGQPGVSVPFGR